RFVVLTWRIAMYVGQALIGLGPEAEARVQVLAHDHVLELRRLDQQAPQLLAVLDHKACLRHQRSQASSAKAASSEIMHVHPDPAGKPPAGSLSGRHISL